MVTITRGIVCDVPEVLVVTLSTELEDLQRAQSSVAEEHERNMRALRLKTESRMLELERKVTEHEKLNLENEAEKARHCEEKEEVISKFNSGSLLLIVSPTFLCQYPGLVSNDRIFWFHV